MRSNRRLRLTAIPLAIVTTIALAGCTTQQTLGWLPTEPGTTNQVDRVIGLWVTSWIVLLAVGAITWGLIIWAAIVYRRRKGQTGLPVQLRYNMPIEIFYTVVPLILVLGFFAFTARDQAEIEAPLADPDVTIEVYGKRWAWDFNYITDDVFYQGIQAQETGPNNEIDVDGQEGRNQDRVARRHPLVLDHRFPVQEGHDSRQDQLLVLHPSEGGHVRGQMR